MKYYYYLFYKLYKFTEDWGFWPDARAFSILILLNFAFMGCLLNFYTIITGTFVAFPDDNIWIYLLTLIVVGVNYILLLNGNKKDEIIRRFDSMPPKQDIYGSAIVFLCVLLLIISYVSSLFMLNSIR